MQSYIIAQNVREQMQAAPMVLFANMFSLPCRLAGCKSSSKGFYMDEHELRLTLLQPDTWP